MSSPDAEKEKANKAEEMRLKVYARVRPPFPGEFDKGGAEHCINYGEDKKTIIHGDRTYEFDEVFPGESTQSEIFEKVAKPTVDNAFLGFTGTVFVYGQTGTGKTHTMSNRYGTNEEHGIIPRAMEYVFERIRNDPAHQYVVTCQYLQLYRDNLQDLQNPDTPFMKLVDAPGGGTIIQGITTSREVTSVDDFFTIYDDADKNRVVAETMMNKQSSRGHSVLTLFVKRIGTEAEMGSGVNGKLVFVDLAGYERIKKTMITDEVRKHEAQAINLSLSALATCIASITAKASHVPFRNSRLTRVLYDSLCGNSVTTVIITMGPSSAHHAETGNTLYFGHNAIQCKTSVKRDLGPIDWHREAIQWKKKAQKLSEQVTELETENTLLLGKLGADVEADDDAPMIGVNRRQSQRDISRRHSGIAEQGGMEALLEELKEANLKVEELDVLRKKAETDTEETKVELEEMSWQLEEEKSKLIGKESTEDELRRLLQQLSEQHSVVTGQLEAAHEKLEQLLPSDDLLPSSSPPMEDPRGQSQDDDVKRPTNVYINYDPAKYVSWSDLVRSEVERNEVKGTIFDRGHWFVCVPDFAAYVADDRKNFDFTTRKSHAKQELDSSAAVSRVWVSGRSVCRGTVSCEVEGVPADHPDLLIEWEQSRNGFDFVKTPHTKGTTLYITADLVHSYVRASAIYLDKKPVQSALVYANIDSTIDEQLQHFTVQGGVQFPCSVAEQLAVSPKSSFGHHVPKAAPTVGKRRFASGFVLSIESSGGVFLKGHDSSVREGTLQSFGVVCTDQGKVAQIELGAGPLLLEATTERDRELMVLTTRLFQALRVKKVGKALLGDAADAWQTQEWLKQEGVARRALLPRLRAVTRTGHCHSPHGSPSRRAGGETTFFQRAEELIEGIASPPPSPPSSPLRASDSIGQLNQTYANMNSPRFSVDLTDTVTTQRGSKPRLSLNEGQPIDLESFMKPVCPTPTTPHSTLHRSWPPLQC